MTQTVPATAVLGPGATGLTIGVRVLNLDGTEYAAFSTTDVAETSVAGTYRKAGGVVCPDAGGYIVWGTALVDYAEATVEPAPLKPTVAGRTLAVDGDGVADANVQEWRNSNVPDLQNNLVPAVVLGVGNVRSLTLAVSGVNGSTFTLVSELSASFIDPAALVGTLVTFTYEEDLPVP